MKSVLVFIFASLNVWAADGNPYMARVTALKPYPGFRTQVLAENIDQAIAFASEHKTVETCAMLGGLESQIEDIKRNQKTSKGGGALDKASYRAFSLTSYCGLKFAGPDVIKEGDTSALLKQLREIGDLVTAPSRG